MNKETKDKIEELLEPLKEYLNSQTPSRYYFETMKIITSIKDIYFEQKDIKEQIEIWKLIEQNDKYNNIIESCEVDVHWKEEFRYII